MTQTQLARGQVRWEEYTGNQKGGAFSRIVKWIQYINNGVGFSKMDAVQFLASKNESGPFAPVTQEGING